MRSGLSDGSLVMDDEKDTNSVCLFLSSAGPRCLLRWRETQKREGEVMYILWTSDVLTCTCGMISVLTLVPIIWKGREQNHIRVQSDDSSLFIFKLFSSSGLKMICQFGCNICVLHGNNRKTEELLSDNSRLSFSLSWNILIIKILIIKILTPMSKLTCSNN